MCQAELDESLMTSKPGATGIPPFQKHNHQSISRRALWTEYYGKYNGSLHLQEMKFARPFEMSALIEEIKKFSSLQADAFIKRCAESISYKRYQFYVDEQNFVSLHLKLMSVAKGNFCLLQMGDYSTQADKFHSQLEMTEQMKTPIFSILPYVIPTLVRGQF